SLEAEELKDGMRKNEEINAGIESEEEVSQNGAADFARGVSLCLSLCCPDNADQATLVCVLALCSYIAASARPTSSFISSPEACAASPIEASTRNLRVPVFPGTE